MMENTNDTRAHQRRDTRVSDMSSDIQAAMAPGQNDNERPACPSGQSKLVRNGKSLEIMAPAGNFECLHAAIQGGADSVYFGVEKLNMRSHSANNFKMTDLKEIVRICSEYGVKTYLTLNITLYNEDLEDMKRTLEAAKEAGITAVIASDMAAIAYARQLGVEVHISTQLSISNAEALRFYAQFADVIVLARELNLGQVKEIKAIIDRCTSSDGSLTDFVFIDEIFKGTNTVERISIADAVIRYLSALENTLAVVSTHDIELARGLEEFLDTYHFNETVDAEKILFSYKLLPGVVYTRNAISLLRLCGYPASILQQAEANAKKLADQREK